MQQFQAGYILDSVFKKLLIFGELNNKTPEINGLFKQLSTFNVATTLNLELQETVPNILAVVSNLITRGLPTLANIRLEEQIAKSLNLTAKFATQSLVCQWKMRQEKLFPQLHYQNKRNNYRYLKFKMNTNKIITIEIRIKGKSTTSKPISESSQEYKIVKESAKQLGLNFDED